MGYLHQTYKITLGRNMGILNSPNVYIFLPYVLGAGFGVVVFPFLKVMIHEHGHLYAIRLLKSFTPEFTAKLEYEICYSPCNRFYVLDNILREGFLKSNYYSFLDESSARHPVIISMIAFAGVGANLLLSILLFFIMSPITHPPIVQFLFSIFAANTAIDLLSFCASRKGLTDLKFAFHPKEFMYDGIPHWEKNSNHK